MAKKNTITIDLDYWTTQARKAEIDKVPYQYIRQKVVRSQRGETKSPIETLTIPELGITLVPKDAKY
jgi:hypothetical protein